MKKLLLGGLLALLAVALIVTVAPAKNGGGKSAKAYLDGYQEVPLAISTTGTGKFKAKVSGESVQYKLRYSGLESAATAAHIHFGREGVAGGVIAFLCGGSKPACPPSGEVTGTIVPADVIGPAAQGIAAGEFDEFVRALKAGATYVNVHTTVRTDGEIRGQINGHHKGRHFGNGHNGGDERGKSGHDQGGRDKDSD